MKMRGVIGGLRMNVRMNLGLKHPVFAISPQLPCMERQQARSPCVIALSVTQANIGAAVINSRRIAKMLAIRPTI